MDRACRKSDQIARIRKVRGIRFDEPLGKLRNPLQRLVKRASAFSAVKSPGRGRAFRPDVFYRRRSGSPRKRVAEEVFEIFRRDYPTDTLPTTQCGRFEQFFDTRPTVAFQ